MTSKLRACTKRPASSTWPSLKDGPRATSTWFSAKHYEPERPMSVRGQTEKNSVRAYVFRFAPRARTLLDAVGTSHFAKTRSLQRLGSCSASSVDVGGSIPSPPTTAGPRHARVSNIWSPAGRSTTCICSDSPHHRGWHICPRNLRLDPHIAARLSLLLPVS
jgi:hypothetical protein